MKNCYVRLINSVIFLTLWTFAISLSAQEVKIVAVVNQEVITSYDLDQAMIYFKGQLDEILDPQKREASEKKGRADVLNELIEDRLLDQEIKKLGIEISKIDVDEEMERIRKNMGLAPDEFQGALRQQGIDPKKYRESISSHLKLLKFIGRTIRPRINIDDQDIEKYYTQHKEQFMEADALHLIQMQVKGKDKAKNFERVRAKLQKKESLADISKEMQGFSSEDLGMILLSDLSPGLRSAVEKLEEGGISQPMVSKSTIVFYQVVEKNFANPLAIEKVREQIRAGLFEREIRREMDIYLQNLRRSAHVEIR